jgi:hypothetical protein
MSDLLEVTAYCRKHDELSRRFAHNGSRFRLPTNRSSRAR